MMDNIILAISYKSPLFLSYKNVSKTDVRQAWIKHPKSGPPKNTQAVEELVNPTKKLDGYR